MVHICGRRYAQRTGETTEVRVYSNQPTVALYLNGKLVDEKVSDKVFVFTVALDKGHNILLAMAGDVTDSITLERVDKEPAIYVLPEVNERAEGVANWFKMAGDLDLKTPMEFPEGKYSIKDSMEELYKCPEAFEIVATTMKLVTGMPVEPGNGMWEMMKKMSPETTAGMIGSMVPDGFLESLNAKLIKFDKP